MFNPFNAILPVDEAQSVGLETTPFIITGVGFTTTTIWPAAEVQLFNVAVTEYVPETEVEALLNTIGLVVVGMKLL